MSRFPDSVATELLASCRRHCCVCLRWRGRNIEIHHIEPVSDGGEGIADNGIPVCFDCHAEIESKSNMGRKFSSAELRTYRDRWFEIVREKPEKLLTASQSVSDTGPLEALLAEMFYNYTVVGGNPDAAFPPLELLQFRKALGLNSLAILPQDVRDAVHETYRAIAQVNHYMERLLHLRAVAADYQATDNVMQKLRGELHVSILPDAIAQLEQVLGKEA